jgi:hypothetical protein
MLLAVDAGELPLGSRVPPGTGSGPAPALSLSNRSVLGGVTETPAGQFQFTDPQAANLPQRYYRFRAP